MIELNAANIKIDRHYYISTVQYLDEIALRGIGNIPDHKELWAIIPGHDDERIDSSYLVKHYSANLRQYYSLPYYINNGDYEPPSPPDA